MIEGLATLRRALRRIARAPALTVTLVATLAVVVAVAVTTASIARAAFLDPFPYRGHERWMVLRGHHPTLHPALRSVPELRDIAALEIFEHVFAGRGWDANLVRDGRPERVRGARITASAFPALGVAPVLGRWLEPEEDLPGGPWVVMISHALWRSALAGDPDVIGSALALEGEPFTVVGVMPPRFLLWGSDFWVPAQIDAGDADRGDRSLVVQGILRRGVSPEQANAALASLARRWQRQHQGEHPEYQGLSLEVSSLLDAVLREVAPALWALLAAAGLLLLAAAANLGGFLMATLTDRRRELAVRAALGATRRRLTRQIFAEVLVPSLLAGLLGHLLAAGLARWMVGLIPFGYFPAETVVVHDSRSLALALALALTAGCAVALLGSLRIAGSSRRGGTALRCGRGGVSLTQVRLARGLVAAQVAIAVAVASAGAHVVESLRRQQAASLGFAAGDAVTARVALPRDRYQEREERVRLYQQMLRQVAAAPGIRQAALAGGLPLQEGAARAVTVAGAPAEATEALAAVRIQVVEGDYLETLGVPLLGGRAPGPRDRADGRPVVAVSQELARRLGGREAAIGRQLSIDGWGEPVAREVVGVVADHLAAELGGPWQPALFVPLPQAATAPASLAVVARGEAAAPALLDAVRAAVAGVDRQLPLYETQTLGELVRDAAGGRRLAAVVLELLTALAAALAFLGVFGLVSHGVSQRRRELGIRLAVGGAPGDLFLAVLRQASALALAGAVAGLGLALLAERLLRRLVLDLAAREPALLAVVALGALLLALAAALVPALRAASVPPAAALRND